MARAVARHQGLVFGDARMSSWRSLFETGAAISGRDSSSSQMSRSVLGCVWEFPEEAEWTCCDEFPRKVSSRARLLCQFGVWLVECIYCHLFDFSVAREVLIYRFSLHDPMVRYSVNSTVMLLLKGIVHPLSVPLHLCPWSFL